MAERRVLCFGDFEHLGLRAGGDAALHAATRGTCAGRM